MVRQLISYCHGSIGVGFYLGLPFNLVMKASFLAGVSFALANVLGVEECL